MAIWDKCFSQFQVVKPHGLGTTGHYRCIEDDPQFHLAHGVLVFFIYFLYMHHLCTVYRLCSGFILLFGGFTDSPLPTKRKLEVWTHYKLLLSFLGGYFSSFTFMWYHANGFADSYQFDFPWPCFTNTSVAACIMSDLFPYTFRKIQKHISLGYGLRRRTTKALFFRC